MGRYRELAEGPNIVARAALVNSAAHHGWQTLEQRPAVNFLAPVFLRLRDDKTVTSHNVRFAQLTDIVGLNSAGRAPRGRKSELVKRAVYVKETKGEKAMRKFIAWKTNKKITGEFPPFVFLFVDFSPGRAEMLKQEMNIVSDEAGLLRLFEEGVAENVKKGWALAG